MGFQFDIDWQSAGIGYGAGLLTSYLLYQSRHVLGSIRRGLTSQTDSAQSFAMMGGDRRYINELTQYALHSHLFHKSIDLTDILIEPRFIPEQKITTTLEDENERLNPLDLIPIVPDYPYLHQPYNINTITVEELGYGERAIALLGLPGSGRTTTLLSIALWSMGKIEFDRPHDPVQERLEEEKQNLSRQERDEQDKARVAIEQRAKEQLREEMGIEVGEELQSAFIPPFRQMAPIYVHLANIHLSNRAWNGNVDPAEPLIRALQYQTGRITSKTMPRKIYNFLNEGVCLVLLDGLDELPFIEQEQKLIWLQAFLDEYNQNFIIITGTPKGYGALQQIGFTPVHLRPWSYQDTKMYVQKIRTSWGRITNQRRNTVDEVIEDTLLPQLWGLNPFETTMKIRHQFVASEVDVDIEDFALWTQDYLTDTFEDAEDAISIMAKAAKLQLDKNFFTLQEWVDEELAHETNIESPVQNSPDDDLEEEFGTSESDDQDSFNDFYVDEQEADFSVFEDAETAFDETDIEDKQTIDENSAEETKKDESSDARQIRRQLGKLLSILLKIGLVERYQGNHYRFRQHYIVSYLSSLTLTESDDNILISKALNPAWSTAIAYASSHTNIETAVEAKMSTSVDILHTNILEVANWLRYTDELAEWRNKYLAYVGQMFVSPGQYLTNRERIVAALVSTRDLNARKIFGRGVQSPQSDVQRLSLLALGVYQQEELMDNLSNYLDAPTDEIRVAATYAIGNIYTEEAYTLLSEELLNASSESVQQVITETFADNPKFGYDILWEILNNEEFKDRVRLRRAAILGIKRLRTDWALIEIYRTYLDDQQWYVKSTAQVAFTERQSQRNKGAQARPQITTLPWLRDWSLSLEDETATEASGVELLNMAMHESNPVIRYLATSNAGKLGVYEHMPEIYRLLNDREDAIRDTAFRALVALQMQMGKPLPVPN